MYPEFAGPRYGEPRHNELGSFQQLTPIVVAFAVNCTTLFIAIYCATILCIMLVRLNRKLDRGKYVEDAVNSERDGVSDEAAKKGFRFLC